MQIPMCMCRRHFNFKGKLVTDVFASYNITKKITVFIGVDNVFNVHPDLGVNPQAKGWFGDNESGGPWDSVQMGFNGRKLFTKLVSSIFKTLTVNYFYPAKTQRTQRLNC